MIDLSRFLIRPGVCCRHPAHHTRGRILCCSHPDFNARCGFRPWLAEPSYRRTGQEQTECGNGEDRVHVRAGSDVAASGICRNAPRAGAGLDGEAGADMISVEPIRGMFVYGPDLSEQPGRHSGAAQARSDAQGGRRQDDQNVREVSDQARGSRAPEGPFGLTETHSPERTALSPAENLNQNTIISGI